VTLLKKLVMDLMTGVLMMMMMMMEMKKLMKMIMIWVSVH